MHTKDDAQALIASKIIPKVIFKYFRAYLIDNLLFIGKKNENTMLLILF
jgi:hypothetical protein